MYRLDANTLGMIWFAFSFPNRDWAQTQCDLSHPLHRARYMTNRSRVTLAADGRAITNSSSSSVLTCSLPRPVSIIIPPRPPSSGNLCFGLWCHCARAIAVTFWRAHLPLLPSCLSILLHNFQNWSYLGRCCRLFIRQTWVVAESCSENLTIGSHFRELQSLNYRILTTR